MDENSLRDFDLQWIVGRTREWSKEFFDWTWLWILFIFGAGKLAGNSVSMSRKTDLMRKFCVAIQSNCLCCIVVQTTRISI